MSTDIKVFLEHLISDEWVLVDVDPIFSAERNSKRLAALYNLKQTERPSNISKGANFWFEGNDSPDFVACLSIEAACELWQKSELHPNRLHMNFENQLITYFGLWEPNVEQWRVIIAV